MADRTFCSPLPPSGAARLEGTEAHHLSRVLRKNVGEKIEVFDGRGRSGLAELVAVSKKTVDLKILATDESPPPLGQVMLVTAVPKGDRFRWLVEKAVELGVDRLVPLITQRSVVRPGEGKREKMQLAVIEACKQSGRNHLMAIAEPLPWCEFLETVLSKHGTGLAFAAHPRGRRLSDVFPSNFPERVIFLVGPEGGFTEEEMAQAEGAGATLVGLGTNILRIETAAIALAAYAAIHRRMD
jgi:16S rRNA (uracil1498-N3)-methyltransferase